MISVDDAVARITTACSVTGSERVDLAQAFGRVLASDVLAGADQPPASVSAMDGYAVRLADATPGATLKLAGESAAGAPFAGLLRAGEAVRIFTGAVMPTGADAILLQEDAEQAGDRVKALAAANGRHVRVKGLDFRAGDLLVPAPRVLTARDLALVAAGDQPALDVRRKPRVAIAATGDELSRPGDPRKPGGIVASSLYGLSALVAQWGGEPHDLGILADSIESIGALPQLAGNADLVITLGGASVGDHDLVQKALTSAGMELGFWRIAMRPGKPLMHGRLGAMRVLGLPGNPTSSMVCAILFLRPLLRALHGEPDAGADPSQPARLAVDLGANGIRQDYMRASLARGAEGVLVATPAADQDSSLVKTMARADGLIIRPPHAPPAKAGDPCRVIAFHGLGV